MPETTAPPGTLAAFLLERIAEDEEAARSVLDNPPYFQQLEWGWFDADFGDFHPAKYGKSGVGLPARVLAECEAKRKLVQRALDVIASFEDWDAAEGKAAGGRVLWTDVNRRERSHAHATLSNLAVPYADHPDYLPEWGL